MEITMRKPEPLMHQVKTLKEYDELMLANNNKPPENVDVKNQQADSNLYCFFSYMKSEHRLKNKIFAANEATAPDKNSNKNETTKPVKVNPKVLPMYTDRTTINVFGEDPQLTAHVKRPSKLSQFIDKFLTIFNAKK